jgi:hypothetical protein
MSATPELSAPARSRVLDPSERVSEILFGLIMVLTFTGSLSVATAGREDTREMLIGAIGCNIAWGIVDAVMYLMSSLTERARSLDMLRTVRGAPDPRQAHQAIADAMPDVVSSALSEAELEAVRQRLVAAPDSGAGKWLGARQWMGALAVFLLVFLSTFPVVLPFIFMTDAWLAMRLSNAIAIAMLFVCGFLLGRHAGYRPWLIGLSMVVIGAVLAAMTLALGG